MSFLNLISFPKKKYFFAGIFLILFLLAFSCSLYIHWNMSRYVQQFNLFPYSLYLIYIRPILYISLTYLLIFSFFVLLKAPFIPVQICIANKSIRKVLFLTSLFLLALYYVLSGFVLCGVFCVPTGLSFLWDHSYLFFVFGIVIYFSIN